MQGYCSDRMKLSQKHVFFCVFLFKKKEKSVFDFAKLCCCRLRLNPENLKAFRANVRRNLTTPAAADSSAENAQKGHPADSAMAKRDQLKICGPCAPVMGLHVHGSLLYVCFQGIGVNSYTMVSHSTVLRQVFSVPLQVRRWPVEA